MTNFQNMRKRLHDAAGLPLWDGDVVSITANVRAKMADFVTLMRNRLIFGHMRYGPLQHEDKPHYDHIKAIRDKLKLYESTGNDELLVDIANYALVEFLEGIHPKKHFAATDDTDHATTKS